jgi:ribosomal protein S18 acetylase RimI-like enzyme
VHVSNPDRTARDPLSAQAVASRVSVRGRLPPPGPGAGDVVGTLVEQTPAVVTIRGRDGRDSTVVRDDIVAARVVPDTPERLRRAVDVDPAVLQRVAGEGWQPIERATLGGWTLRAARGFTGRANSVLPLGSPGRPLDLALVDVRAWYGARGLPPRFQVPLPWGLDLDQELAERGWAASVGVDVLVADLSEVAASLSDAARGTGVVVSLTAEPGPDWLATYRYRGEPLPPGAVEVLLRADHPVFVTVRDHAGPVAVGRGAVTPGWVGVTALDVAARARRRGMARLVLRALAEQAQQAGARFAYLQVAQDNVAARALYDRCGFAAHHRYHYRVPHLGPREGAT